MAHLKDNILINAPVEKVDAVVGDPNNWATFMTGMSGPEKISGDGGVGTVVEHRMALMWGIRRPATTKVTEERHDPDGGTFWRWDKPGRHRPGGPVTTSPATARPWPQANSNTLCPGERWARCAIACLSLGSRSGPCANHGEREAAGRGVLAGATGRVRASSK